jgi:hypothetical protein
MKTEIEKLIKKHTLLELRWSGEPPEPIGILRNTDVAAAAIAELYEARLAEVRQHLVGALDNIPQQHLVGALDNIPQPGPNAVLWLIRARQELEKALAAAGGKGRVLWSGDGNFESDEEIGVSWIDFEGDIEAGLQIRQELEQAKGQRVRVKIEEVKDGSTERE